jgi:hypothetical protein
VSATEAVTISEHPQFYCKSVTPSIHSLYSLWHAHCVNLIPFIPSTPPSTLGRIGRLYVRLIPIKDGGLADVVSFIVPVSIVVGTMDDPTKYGSQRQVATTSRRTDSCDQSQN